MAIQQNTPLEPLKTTFKDVNNQKIDFVCQTKATVKKNNETIELSLLITKAQTAPLMGLDRIQRLKINLSSNRDTIHIHNKNIDNTERRIIKLQIERLKDVFYNKNEMIKCWVKTNLKATAQIIQQKRRPIPILVQDQVEQELKRQIKHDYVERATEITEDCFVRPAVTTVNKDKSVKIALDSKKLNEVTVTRKALRPNM